MSNMSYCRFQNTLLDVRECLNVLREPDERKELSDVERRAAKTMLEEISDFFDEMDLVDEDGESLAPIYGLLYGDDDDGEEEE